MNQTVFRTLLFSFSLLALCGCLELDPLDPNKPLPDGLFTGADIDLTPPPRCSTAESDPAAITANLKIYVIDVGQGDAILIRTPDDGIPNNNTAEGYNILIDAGDGGFTDRTDGYFYVSQVLDRLDIETIDYAIVTHAHSDHFGGMTRLFSNYNVTNIVDPGFDNNIPTYNGYLTAAENQVRESGGQFIRPTSSTLADILSTIDLGDDIKATILHGSPDLGPGSSQNSRINNTSIVLKVTFAGISALFMGDAEEEIEAQLIAAGTDLRSHILKVGHHGSESSSTQDFLDAVWDGIPTRSRFAAISSGRSTFSGVQLPRETTIERLRLKIGDTDREDGNSRLFSTENDDDEKDESEAAGDDNILITISPDGAIRGCYIR